MNGDPNPSVGVDLRAVGTGMVWGLGLMVLGSLSQGVLDFVSPLGPKTAGIMDLIWPAAGALTGGFLAARRAAGTGWLHGVLAGAGLVLCLGTIMGVASGLPTLAWLLKVGGISAGTGLLGGVLGVNSSGR